MSNDVYTAIYKIAEKLELPVLILALVALALVTVELGAFLVELQVRSRRKFATLAKAAAEARRSVDEGRRRDADAALQRAARSKPMARSFTVLVDEVGKPGADTRLNKELADFDFARQKRLGRTRLLVRFGPALGLMGTLIPLSPALDGLAKGNVTALTDNLRVAFSVTVLGLFIGGVAFGLSLVRERMYGQDFSDLEYVAAILTADHEPDAVVLGAFR